MGVGSDAKKLEGAWVRISRGGGGGGGGSCASVLGGGNVCMCVCARMSV